MLRTFSASECNSGTLFAGKVEHPSQIGPYRILKKIASGGMAEIFLARQQAIEGFERTVVLKRILPEHSRNAEFVTMFLDEVRLMAALSHPNIVQALDLGQAEGSYYLVMEYVRGATLGDLLRSHASSASSGTRGLPHVEALGVILEVAEALAYVHDLHDEFARPLNIVHRDLNPANVIVSYDGAVKLIDFGIAKAASKVYQTRTEVVKGTHGYIAPEQFAPPRTLDHRADVYALGVLLYQTCVGRHPFEASGDLSMMRRVMEGAFVPPQQAVAGFPETLAQIIVRCMAIDPGQRPQTVRSLIQELAGYMRERGIGVTMGELGALARRLVPPSEGPAPLRPFGLGAAVEPLAASGARGDETRAAKREARDAAMAHADTLMVEGASLPMPLAPTVRPSPIAPRATSSLPAETSPRRVDPPTRTALPQARRPTPRAPLATFDPPMSASVGSKPLPFRPLRLDTPTPLIDTTERRRQRGSSGWLVGTTLMLSTAIGVLLVAPLFPVEAVAVVQRVSPSLATQVGALLSQAPWRNVFGASLVSTQPSPSGTSGVGGSSGTMAGGDGAVSNRSMATVGDQFARMQAEVEVVSVPGGALVKVNNRPVGTTPLRVAVPEDANDLLLRVELDGYSVEERVIAANDRKVRFMLTPLPSLRSEAGRSSP